MPPLLQHPVLIKEYYEDLVSEGFTVALFSEVVALYRRRAKFWPKIPDLVAIKEEAQALIDKNRPPTRGELPYNPDKASREFGSMCCENIRLMLKGKITLKEAIDRNTPRRKGSGIDIDYHRRRNSDHEQQHNPGEFVRGIYKNV